MTHRTIAACSVVILVLFAPVHGRAQTNEPAKNAPAAALPAQVSKIVTKDPEFLKLLNPPQGKDFLQAYSKSYRDASAATDAKVSSITDEALRSQARNEEWARVSKSDGDKFWYEAEVAFRDAKISFAQQHRDAWLEIGRVAYEQTNNVLVAAPIANSPFAANLRVAMSSATLAKIYAAFHDQSAEEIDRKAHEYVARAGAGSNCARNPDWCLPYAKQEIEQNLRSERIVMVAAGDLQASSIDRLLLVDEQTETVVLELDALKSALAGATWRFSVGPVAAPPVEAAAAATEAPPVPARVKVPANVTAASILTRTNPEYPPQARAGWKQGEVILHAIIDTTGKISEAQVLEGDDILARSALEAVRHWTYKPMLVDGQPREVDTTITVTFSLKD
jgi:TonB family protein